MFNASGTTSMKSIINSTIFATLLCLTACASGPTLSQLEDEALTTGDWSKVEAREQSDQRRRPQPTLQCPKGKIAYCESHLDPNACRCVSASTNPLAIAN